MSQFNKPCLIASLFTVLFFNSSSDKSSELGILSTEKYSQYFLISSLENPLAFITIPVSLFAQSP